MYVSKNMIVDICVYLYIHFERRKYTIAIMYTYIHIKSQSTFMPLLLEDRTTTGSLDNHFRQCHCWNTEEQRASC